MKFISPIIEFLRSIRVPLCAQCGHPILMTHRFRLVHHKFLWFRWDSVEHRHCERPQTNPYVEY